MNKAFRLLLGLSLSFAALAARADVQAPDVQAPDALIRETADEVLAAVKQDKDLRAGNQKKLLELVEAKVLPHFDFEKMTRLALGVPWRQATAEQRQALVSEFRTLLVRTYTAAFSRYQDQKVEVKPAVLNPKKPDEATVNTQIVKPGSQPIAVVYKLSKKDTGWKVFDLYVDGASLVAAYNGTFAEEVQKGGIDGLIKTLAGKNRTNAAEPINKAGHK